KPFQTCLPEASYGNVDVYNTGGWVVDTLRTAPLQGGAVILISEDLDCASLRFYNQADDDAGYRVELAQITPVVTGQDQFRRRLETMIDSTSPPWSSFSKSAAALVKQRHEDLETILKLRGE